MRRRGHRPRARASAQAQAGQVFDAYVATSNQAAATDDGKLALSVVTGGAASRCPAALGSHSVVVSGSRRHAGAYSSTLSVQPALGQYTYGAPAFYLPQAAGYPRFFVASVTRAPAVKDATKERPARSAGRRCRSRPRADAVLEQSAAGGGHGSWPASPQFPAGTTCPGWPRTRTATSRRCRSPRTDLLAQPYATGPLQAAVVDDGPASAAAKAVAAGR